VSKIFFTNREDAKDAKEEKRREEKEFTIEGRIAMAIGFYL
jgi:hypothetical protein